MNTDNSDMKIKKKDPAKSGASERMLTKPESGNNISKDAFFLNDNVLNDIKISRKEIGEGISLDGSVFYKELTLWLKSR